MAVALDEFVSAVASEALGVPNPYAINALRKSAIDLCRRAGVWRDVQGTTTYEAGVATYTLPAPADADILRTNRLTLDSARFVFPATIDATMPDWRTKQGGVLYFLELTPGVVSLARVPEVDGELEFVVDCAPSTNAVTVPDELYRDHFETVVHGALWRLHAMLDKPWTSATAVQYHQGRFAAGVQRARIDANKLGAAELRVAPRPFV